jgi:hypothetical protein
VRGGNGQCTDWSAFFIATLEAQGVTRTIKAERILVDSKDGEERDDKGGFLVKEWTFSSTMSKGRYPYVNYVQDLAFPGYPNFRQEEVPVNGVKIKKWVYNFLIVPAKPQVRYSKPAAAQGNSNPPGLFPNHALVRIGKMYYDPSYGVKYESLQDFQDKAISGFYTMRKLTMLIRKNVPGTPLLRERVIKEKGEN